MYTKSKVAALSYRSAQVKIKQMTLSDYWAQPAGGSLESLMPLASTGSLGRLCLLSDFSSSVSIGGMFSPAPSVAELTLCGEEELYPATTFVASRGGGRGVDSGSPTGRGGGPA